MSNGIRKEKFWDESLLGNFEFSSLADMAATFQVLSRKAYSFDTRSTPTEFVRLRKHATYDERALAALRRRIEGSNFLTHAAPVDVSPPSKGECVIIVDAFSTGACMALEAARRGLAIVHVLSLEPSEELAAMVPTHVRGRLPWVATLAVDTGLSLEDGATRLAAKVKNVARAKKLTIAGLAAGAETGVKLADMLSELLGLRTNGTRLTEARRNKAEMGEAVRRSGARAVRQLRAASWEPVAAWLRDEWGLANDDPCLLIVKPLESAGSDGVTKCESVGDVERAVRALVGSLNGLGQINEGVLVQEFLEGPEFVVDSVSKDGVHKVIALWSYDRRPTNGAGFVLHGQSLVGSSDPVVAPLVAYAEQVLDALEIKHGPAHMEVKMCPAALDADPTPCLVEVGARCHGAEGFWMTIADQACRANQANVALDALVDDPNYDNLPSLPPPTLHAAACLKYLLTHKAGVLDAVDDVALASVTRLPSYQGHEIFLDVGTHVIPTKDCFSWGGVVKLAHKDPAQLQQDYSFIEQLCVTGLWHIRAPAGDSRN